MKNMRLSLPSLAVAACVLSLKLATVGSAQTALVDFEMDNATVSGTSTSTLMVGPDSNGDYGSNFDVDAGAQATVAPGYSKALLTTGNVSSGATMAVTSSDTLAINGGDAMNLNYVPLALNNCLMLYV